MAVATQMMEDADLRFTQASSSIDTINFALGTPRSHGEPGEDGESLSEEWDMDPPTVDPNLSPFLEAFLPPEDSSQPPCFAQPEHELSPELSPSLPESASS
jgi:hypothetical protein